jgi:hypothetical protein
MKKNLVLVIALAMLSGFAFAGDNQSACYLRMIAREPATNSIDIAYFNPAGTAFLAPGIHSLINAQTVYLNYEYTNALNTTSYEIINWIPFVPVMYLRRISDLSATDEQHSSATIFLRVVVLWITILFL